MAFKVPSENRTAIAPMKRQATRGNGRRWKNRWRTIDRHSISRSYDRYTLCMQQHRYELPDSVRNCVRNTGRIVSNVIRRVVGVGCRSIQGLQLSQAHYYSTVCQPSIGGSHRLVRGNGRSPLALPSLSSTQLLCSSTAYFPSQVSRFRGCSGMLLCYQRHLDS